MKAGCRKLRDVWGYEKLEEDKEDLSSVDFRGNVALLPP